MRILILLLAVGLAATQFPPEYRIEYPQSREEISREYEYSREFPRENHEYPRRYPVYPNEYVDTEIGWRPGTELEFKYDSQVLTGIPTTSNQYSGLKIRCTVKTQLIENNKVLLKLKDIKILTKNDLMVTVPPTEIAPESVFTEELPEEQARHMIEWLTTPISFTIENGYISEVEAPQEEPYFTINIKKGIINLFQVNLDQRGHMEDTNVHRMDYRDYSKMFTEPADYSFHVMEPGVCGTCESIYTLIPNIPTTSGPPLMMLNKVRNYLNCLKKPVWESGILAGVGHHIKVAKELEKPLLKAYSHTDYVLAGTRKDFIIKKALASSKFVFNPFEEHTGSATTFIVQQLELIKLDPNPASYSPIKPVVSQPLIMTIPTPITSPSPKPERTLHNSIINENKITQIEHLIEEVIDKTELTLDWTVPEVVTKLILAMSECSVEELITIAQKYITPGTPWLEKRKELLMGILPSLSNPAVAPVITNIIMQNITGIPNWRPGLLLSQMCMTIPPSPMVITSLLTLIKEPRIRVEKSTWRPAMLGLGTVTHKLVKLCEKTEIPKGMCVPAISEVVQTIEEMFDGTSVPYNLTLDEKLTILKTIGNTGLPDFLPLIRTILHSNRGPKCVHTQAIYALRRIAPIVPRAVQSTLLPTFLDPRRSEYERIAAFVVLMDTKPSFGVLQVITHSLNTEINLQVGSFVYSYLRSIAGTSNPTLWKFSQNVRMCLISARPIIVGMTYSKAYHLDIYSELLKQGVGLDAYLINTPSNIIPKTIVTKLNVTLHGLNTEFLEVGVDTEGLDTLIRKLVGPYGVLDDIIQKKSPIVEAFEPHLKPLWGSVGEDMRKILRKISIKERPEEAFRGMMHIKLFGNEIRHWVVDPQLIRSIQQTGISILETMLTGRKEVDVLEVLPSGESSLLLPTPIGIPVSLNVSAMGLVRLKGYLEVTGLPSLQHLLTGRVMPDEIKLTTNIMASGLAQLKGKMGVVTPLVLTGAMFTSKVLGKKPCKLEAAVNMRDYKFTVSYVPPTEEMEMLRWQHKPMTFLRLMPTIPTPEFCILETKEIVNRTILTYLPIKTKLVSPLLDTELLVECQLCKRIATYTPYWPLTGRSECKYVLRPKRESAKVITVEFFKRYEPLPPTVRRRDSGESWFGWFDQESSEEVGDLSRSWRIARNSPKYPMPVTPDTLLGPGPKRYIVEMIAKTDTEKYYKTKVDVMCSQDYLVYQANLQVVGEPFIIYETTMTANRVMMINTLVNTQPILHPFYKYRTQPYKPKTEPIPPNEPIFKLFFNLGQSSVTEKELKIIVKTDVSKSVPVHWTLIANPEVPVYTFMGETELKYPKRELVDPLLIDGLLIIQNLFRKYISVNTTFLPTLPTPSPGKVLVKLHVCPALERAVVYVKTPLNLDREVMIPLRCPWLEPFTTSVEPAFNLIPHIPVLTAKKFKSMFSGECKVMEDKIMTYDSVPYPIPQLSPECEVILTKDCSSQGVFTVTATLPQQTSSRLIKLLIPNYRIEVVPESREPRVTVNDQNIPLTNEPYFIRERNQESSPIEVELKKLSEGVEINCKKLGLTVMVEPQLITVHAPTTLRSRTCGLCGNFNGETSNEWEGPDMTIYSRPEDFVKRYVIPSRRCEVSTSREQTNSGGSSSMEGPETTCKSKRMTLMHPRDHRGVPETCFSTEPVHVCRGPCQTIGIRSELIPFHCLPADDNSTKRLEKKMRRTVLNEMENKPVHMRDYVNTQESCTPLY